MSTAVTFFAKNGHKIAEDPNVRIGDDLYLMLAKEYNKDMALKLESASLLQKRQLKAKAEEPAAEPVDAAPARKEPEHVEIAHQPPHVKTVGHIDLDALNRPAATVKAKETVPQEETSEPVAAVENEPIEEQVETPAEDKPQEQPQSVNTIEETPEETVAEEETVDAPIEPAEEEPAAADSETETSPEVTSDAAEAAEPEEASEAADSDESEAEKAAEEPASGNEQQDKTEDLFVIRRPRIEKTPVVVGQIDLDQLNQSTRPKSKTKEQRKKERDEKIRQQQEQKKVSTDQNWESKAEGDTEPRKKRERIKQGKIDTSKPQEVKKDKKHVKQRPLRTEISEEDVQKQIKDTLARLSGAKNKGKGAKYRKEKREHVRAAQEEQMMLEHEQEKILKLTEFVTANELAVMMNVSVNQVIATCMSIGLMVSINQRLDAETINIVAEEFGFTTEYVDAHVMETIGEDEEYSDDDLVPRAPIVTVMGHVDHGKTSLLDYIRKTNVIAGEAGGITQHIGAYNVKLENGQRITFLDTPGHEAFTAMRARGAKVTDLVIIIVAADDNVMPQTIEAINHASAAGVPIIFAINKIDKPGANPDKIKETLANMNYMVEEWGGKYQSQDISAKKGIGVAELLEKVLLEAELLDLKANPKRRAVGSVIESSLDKGRGYVATVLMQDGTLHMGDIVLAGTHHGRVKAMFNERNQRIKEVRPGEPALILGLNGAPQAGDNFNVVPTEQEAREIANKREQLQREQSIRTKKHFTLDELGRRIALGDFKELNIIVKGDVDGSVEALSDSLLKLSTENIQINVIHKAVGAISDSDILLAAASNAIICGFQVRPTASARKMAEREEIDIRLYSIIYDAIEEIKAAMEGMLAPDIKEEVTATLEILEVFKITKVGSVAGCIVREGKIKRTNKVRVIRDGIVVFTGELASLKRMKEDVKEVGVNFECGLNVKNYNDIKVGDLVEAFEEVEVRKEL